MFLDNFVKQLAIDLAFERPPASNEKGMYTISLGDGLSVSLQELNPGFVFSSRIAPPPKKESNEELFSTLMMANLFGQGTGGGILSLDRDEKWIFLSQEVLRQLDYVHFKDILEEFANAADFWKKKVKTFSDQTTMQTDS